MVRFAPKLTFGPEVADWQERFNPDRMRRQRVERAQTLMRKYGIAAILEANHQNIRYLTALKGFAYPMCRYVLFFAEHDPVMYEHDGYYHQMPDQCPWIKEWRPARSCPATCLRSSRPPISKSTASGLALWPLSME